MRSIKRLAVLAVIVATLGACTQGDRAVRGFESGPGGWTKISETHTAMESDVTYLGASADGHMILRLADGTTQIWRANR